MNDPVAVTQLRANLWAAGYRPIPIFNPDWPVTSPGKKPLGDGWQIDARANPPLCTRSPAVAHALNTGILSDGLRAVDFDIDDPVLAVECRQLADVMLGATATRIRQGSPRALVLYRAAEGEPGKLTLTGRSHTKDHACKIEVLGRGQQFVAFGGHPSGAELRWYPAPPGDEEPRDGLIAVTEEQIQAFLEACAPIIDAPVPGVGNGLNGHAKGSGATDTVGLLNPFGALIERIQTASGGWHDDMVRLTAKLVARGVPRAAILCMATELTRFDQKDQDGKPYTVEDTKKELTTMLDGAFRKYAPGEGAEDGDETVEDIVADVMDVPPKDAPEPTPEIIDGDWWLARELARPVPVLGEVICTSTRVMIGGPTGVGKTHLAMGMASAVATSNGFLHWTGPATPLPVLYIDGEMARDLIQDRMRDLQRRMGGASLANLHMLCREDFPAMQGLNTLPGRTFALAAVEHLKPSIIFLDSRMCLLVGDMKDEVPWTETMPLVWALTRRQVAQVWLDHTGHDGGHIYGSKTKEWQLDAVGLLGEVSDPRADLAMRLEWTKARRRRPETKADFSPGIVTLSGDTWLWTPDETRGGDKGAKREHRISDETELLRRAIDALAYDPSLLPRFVPETSFPVRAVSRGIVLKSYLITSGWFTETCDYVGSGAGRNDPTPPLTDKGRDRLRNSLNTLKRLGLCGFNRDLVWPVR